MRGKTATWQILDKMRISIDARWHGNLKGLSYERGWLKPADNLSASPFKRDLSNDTTFS
jgi:hypothetical protein